MAKPTDDKNQEYYCFISYKHKKNGKFEKDQSWAEKLEGSFHRTKISVPPVAEQTIIRGTSDDSNEYIGRIYRDFTNLSAGYYSEEILTGLKSSRKLVSIISDEMLDDQNAAVDKAQKSGKEDIYGDAWCYKEIRDFISYPSHTLDDVILVYIGKRTEFSLDIVPALLLDAQAISIIEQIFPDSERNDAFRSMTLEEQRHYLEEYWEQRNAILVYKEGERVGLADLIAAKVACNIFGLKGEGAQAFISFREQQLAQEEAEKKAQKAKEDQLRAEAKTEKERRKRIFWTASLLTFILIVAIFFMWQRGQVISAYRYLEQAKIAFANLNIPEAVGRSLKAEKAGGSLQEIKEFQRKAYENDYTKPFQVIRKKTVVSSPDNSVWTVDEEEGKAMPIGNHAIDETIYFPRDYFAENLDFSSDGRMAVMRGYDSIYVYSRDKSRYVFSTPFNGGWSSNAGDIQFSSGNMYMLRHWQDSIVVHSLIQNKESIIIHDNYDRVAADESELMAISHSKDSLFLSRFSNDDCSFSRVESWPLLATFTDMECNPLTHTVITISKDTIAYYSPVTSHILYILSEAKYSMHAYDKQSDRFVLFAKLQDSNGYRRGEINLWDKDHFVARNNSFSDVKCITTGQSNDVIFYSDGRVYVWRYADNKTFTLDASNCEVSELLFRLKLVYDGENIILAEDDPGIENDFYALFKYPDFSFLKVEKEEKWPLCDGALFATRKYLGSVGYLIRVYDSTEETLVWEVQSDINPRFENKWILLGDRIYSAGNGKLIASIPTKGFIRDAVLEAEHRFVLLGKHKYQVYSLDSGELISECLYPFSEVIEVIETDSFGDGTLYADLRHFSYSDIGSMKGRSWLISIDLETGQQKGCIFREGFFFLSNDGQNIILSSENGDIQLLDGDLHTIRELNIGEYVAGRPQRAINGKYYAASNDGNLYCCSFDNSSVKRVPLPHRSQTFNGKLLNGRYYLIYTDDINSNAKFLYDLINDRIVLYLLPEETIEQIRDKDVVVRYQSKIPNLTLRYSRPILTDKELSAALKERYKQKN